MQEISSCDHVESEDQHQELHKNATATAKATATLVMGSKSARSQTTHRQKTGSGQWHKSTRDILLPQSFPPEAQRVLQRGEINTEVTRS